MDNQVPPHFHYLDPIPEKNIVPDGSYVSVVPDWPAPEGSEVTYYDGSTFARYKMVDGVWREIGGGGSGTPGGDDTQVQFNDGGSFGGATSALWDKTNDNLILGRGSDNDDPVEVLVTTPDSYTGLDIIVGKPHNSFNPVDTGDGGELRLQSGDGGTDSGDGGPVTIIAGDTVDGRGGTMSLTAGNATSGSNIHGGDVEIGAGGASGFSGVGGDVTIGAGSFNSGDGDGGNVYINGGTASGDTGYGGDIFITPGNGASGGEQNGDVVLSSPSTVGAAKQGRVVIYDQLNATSYRFVGEILTTNATPQTYTIAGVPDDSSLFIEAKITAFRTGGSSGSAGDSAAYVRRALYKRLSGGAPSLVGSVQDDFTQEDQAGWDATFTITSNDILLQVTGAANNDITWHFEILYLTSANGII